jgi:ADP-ribose pyrophosphatase YjhB (NUDIX family)
MYTISVDNLIFGCRDGVLEVCLIQHASGPAEGRWGLPGDWIKDGESLADAAIRTLRSRIGINDIFLEQLHTFSALDRYPGKRVITTAYYALVRPEDYETVAGAHELDARWFAVNEVPELMYDHQEILTRGINRLRQKVKLEPIGFNLLPTKFTLTELQKIYEAVLDIKLNKPNFRRKMTRMNLLIDCEEKQSSGGAHRAGKLYRFDQAVYNSLNKQGFVFEF